jgi:hypothetical protein
MSTIDQNLDRLDTRERVLNAELVRVQVVKFDIPFLQLVWLLIKLAIAAIPAAIIFGTLVAAVTAVLGMMLGGVFSGFLNGFHWI